MEIRRASISECNDREEVEESHDITGKNITVIVRDSESGKMTEREREFN